MKRFALIISLIGLLPLVHGADSASERGKVRDLMSQATKAMAASQFDQAIPLYEQVISGHPEAGRTLFDAQSGIAQALAKKGDFAGALKAAHVCLDGAPTYQTFDSTVTLIANLLSARDKNMDQANQFIAWQQNGLAAGQPNPMDAIGYPIMSGREHAFDAIRAQAGNDVAASRLRAITYLYSGHPKEALAQYAEAFRRADSNSDLVGTGTDLVYVGLRAVRGSRTGLEEAMAFVIYGPNGPDGKPGTADDLKDPFAGLLPAPPLAEAGGASGIKPEDLALLKQIRDAALLYAGDPLIVPEIRRSAFAAIQRVNTSIDGWGAPGQKEWYVGLILGTEGPPLDRSNMGSVLSAAQLAARGREPDYGGVWSFWSEIDADCTAAGIAPTKEMEDARAKFKKMSDDLAKQKWPAFAVQPLKAPAKF